MNPLLVLVSSLVMWVMLMSDVIILCIMMHCRLGRCLLFRDLFVMIDMMSIYLRVIPFNLMGFSWSIFDHRHCVEILTILRDLPRCLHIFASLIRIIG